MADPATTTEIDRLLAAGAIVGGKYRIVRKLGAGAMGVVVAAEHLELGESIALKILNSELRGNREALARFTREARAMFALKGPHVGRVFDVGKLDSGEPFIVMELLTGMTLKESLEKTARPKLEDSILLMRQISEAVGEAHAANIVHRDLKPENIFVSIREGKPFAKVIDFGVSKARIGSRPELTLTSADAMLGTPRYMAPEQFLNSQSADARSDVWSLGVIFYRMITGKFPFEAKDAADLLTQIRTKRPRLPHDVAPDVRTEISAIAMRCLAQRPQERYANARELHNALSDLGTSRAQQTRPPQTTTAPAITLKRPDQKLVVTDAEIPADDPTTPHTRASIKKPLADALAAKAIAANPLLEAAALPPSSRPISFTDELTQKTPRGTESFPDIDTMSDPAKKRVEDDIDENFELDTVVGPMQPKTAPPKEDTTTKRNVVGDSTDVMVKGPMIPTPAPMIPAPLGSSASVSHRADPFSETRRYSGVPPIPVSAASLPSMQTEASIARPRPSPWSAVAIAIAVGAALATVAMVGIIRYREQSRAAAMRDALQTTMSATPAAPQPPPPVYAPNPVNQGTSSTPNTAPITPTPSTAETTRAPSTPPRYPRGRGPSGASPTSTHGPNDPNW